MSTSPLNCQRPAFLDVLGGFWCWSHPMCTESGFHGSSRYFTPLHGSFFNAVTALVKQNRFAFPWMAFDWWNPSRHFPLYPAKSRKKAPLLGLGSWVVYVGVCCGRSGRFLWFGLSASAFKVRFAIFIVSLFHILPYSSYVSKNLTMICIKPIFGNDVWPWFSTPVSH